MEFAENGSLDESRIEKNDRNVRNLFLGIISGMKFLHSHGIVHRDLAPRNILLDKNNNPKITDFGLARVIDFMHQNYEMKQTKRLPIRYLSPEVIHSRKYCKEGDVWMFACCMYEFLAGEKPYSQILDLIDVAKGIADGSCK